MSDDRPVLPSVSLAAWNFIAQEEGGGRIHTVAGDPGGTTKWGFAQNFNQDIDVTLLTHEEAFNRFLGQYWNALHCDKLVAPIAIALADYAFNAGADDAVPDLQRTVGARVDGVVGQRTITAVNERYNQRPARVVNDYLSYRCLKYCRTGRAENNRGWFVRVLNLRAFLAEASWK